MIKTADNLGKLRITGMAEAISWVFLLFLAMPLKYIWGEPLAVKIVGWIHGILFIAYMLLSLIVVQEKRWPFKRLVYAGLAAFLPFGTWFYDKQLKKFAQT